jgi:outer membrane protein
MKDMKKLLFPICLLVAAVAVISCAKPGTSDTSADAGHTGLKIAFVNGDTVLHHFVEFRKESEAMAEKQRKAEDLLQSKGAALEKEIMAYQQQAQRGTMTGKEMEAKEKYLGSRQEAILAERDKIAKEIMDETTAINNRLQEMLHKKLDEIKVAEGYDFILSMVEGGAILAANEKYDITDQVLKLLNKEEEEQAGNDQDTTKQEQK